MYSNYLCRSVIEDELGRLREMDREDLLAAKELLKEAENNNNGLSLIS